MKRTMMGMAVVVFCAWPTLAEEPTARTTLSQPTLRYQKSSGPYVVLRRGSLEVMVVDNRAVDDEVLPRHRAGYNGVGSLKHSKYPANLFVPDYAGLNFEHIHDGTVQAREVLFEPRFAPMELRILDPYTAELYQAPTPHYGLESCTQYRLLEDDSIEMVFECVPRRASFRNGYVGLFWASYIHQPESRDIHFLGYEEGKETASRWICASSPKHGLWATHLAADDNRLFSYDPQFPLTLVFNGSRYRYTRPWYYGVSHGMALVLAFRSKDRIRFSQSPSGGGEGNPAWDFQFFIPHYEVGKRYQMVMRAGYIPYQSPEQIARIAEQIVEELERSP